jgi:hypothetical protein
VKSYSRWTVSPYTGVIVPKKCNRLGDGLKLSYHLVAMSKKDSGSPTWTFHHPFGMEEIEDNAEERDSSPVELGPIVAERSFTLFKRDGTPLRVTVRLGTPFVVRPEPESLEYRCPAQIVGIGNDRVHAPSGLDPFLALQYAMHLIGVKLDNFVHRENLEIRFPSGSDQTGSGWIWRYPPA